MRELAIISVVAFELRELVKVIRSQVSSLFTKKHLMSRKQYKTSA